MTEYAKRKEAVRSQAIEWSDETSESPMSWADLAGWQAYFERMGRRYGLLREFRENGIC